MEKIYYLINEAAAVEFFWENAGPLVLEFIFDVDGVGVQLEEAPTSYGSKPDGIWGRQVHVEFKSGATTKECPGLSARALLHHVHEIFSIGSATLNDGKGP